MQREICEEAILQRQNINKKDTYIIMKEQQKKQNKNNRLWMKRAYIILFLDVISVLVSYLAALLLRFDFVFSSIPREYLDGYMWSMPYWVIITVVVFYGFRLYHSIWRFAGMDEAKRIIQAYIALFFPYLAGTIVMDLHMPKSYYFVGYVFNLILTVGVRFSYRLVRSWITSKEKEKNEQEEKPDRVMVIGAGKAGQALIKEMKISSHLNTKVCCVIDDNPNKKGRLLEGVPIVGNRYDIVDKVKEY